MKNKLQKTLPLALAWLAFFALSMRIVEQGDDFVFGAAVQRYGGFFKWLVWFACNWGGRIVPQGLQVAVMQYPPVVFAALDASFKLLLAVYTHRVLGLKNLVSIGVFTIILALVVYLVVPMSLLSQASFWKSALVLYTWGLATMMIALDPLVREERGYPVGAGHLGLGMLSMIYTASFEQAGMLMCGIMLVITTERLMLKKKATVSICFTVISICLTMLFFLLPGNHVRTVEEMLMWFPEYVMFSPLKKLMLGIYYAVSHLESEIFLLIGVIAFLTALLLSKTSAPRLLQTMAWLVCTYFVLYAFVRFNHELNGTQMRLDAAFELLPIDTPTFSATPLALAKTLVHYMVYATLGCCILTALPTTYDVLTASLYFGGIGSLVVMGFSPTIYASSSRPRFLCYYLMICVALRLLAHLQYLGNQSPTNCPANSSDLPTLQ